MDAQQVIEDSKPMLDDVLGRIGIHTSGTPLVFARLAGPFSNWLAAQDISEEDRAFLTALVGAFICEYLIAEGSGNRVVENGRIMLRVPVLDGVAKQFDPYATAMGLITTRGDLESFLESAAI